MRLHQNQNRFCRPDIRRDRPDDESLRAAAMKGSLTFVRIFVQFGMSLALTTVTALSIFMVIRYVAWVG